MPRRPAWPFAALTLALAALFAGSLTVGGARFGLAELTEAAAGTGDPKDRAFVRMIVAEVRAPRLAMAVLVGLALGGSGAAYQALFQNPLADPFIIGSSSGAACGVALAVTLGAAPLLPVAAFTGAILSVALVYGIAAAGRMPTATLLLVGTAVSTVLSALLWLMMALADTQLNVILGWLMGGLGGPRWDKVAPAAPLILAGVAVLSCLGRPLDALACGDDAARALGLRVGLLTAVVLGASSLAVGAAVAAGGVVGFVGLVAPHLARPLVGVAHARVVPASALIGAGLVLLADDLARTVAVPHELPLGVMTSLLGGPFLLVVLVRILARQN